MLKHIVAATLGLILAALIVVGFEAYARRHEYTTGLVDHNPCRQMRPELGAGFAPSCKCRWKRAIAGKLVYNVGLQTDEYRRRITPQTGGRQQLIAFFGCSFTLGAGVDQSDTLPARFAAIATDHRCLNYGGSGFGPQHTLIQIDKLITKTELGSYTGEPLAIYTMIPGHIGRVVGSFEVIGTFGRYFPAYGLDDTGNLVYRGKMAQAYPLRTRLATSSALLRRLPGPKDPASVELMARVLLRAKYRWKERFGGKFLVIAYPGSWAGNELLLTRLRALGLNVLETQDPSMDPNKTPSLRLRDRHPTVTAHFRAAQWMYDAMLAGGWLPR